jgi:hypothetical protein
MIDEKYGIDIKWILERDEVKDHHDFVKCIAKEAESSEEVVRTLVIEAYISDIGNDFDELIQDIKREMHTASHHLTSQSIQA